jgi:Na+/H+ antiporter NhaA
MEACFYVFSLANLQMGQVVLEVLCALTIGFCVAMDVGMISFTFLVLRSKLLKTWGLFRVRRLFSVYVGCGYATS